MGTLRIGYNARTLTDRQLRGWSRYTINLLEALLEFDVHFYLFSDRPLSKHFLDRLPKDRYTEVVAIAPAYILWEQALLPKLCFAHKVDLLHCPTNYGLPAISPVPSVLTLHDAIGELYELPKQNLRSRLTYGHLQWRLSSILSRHRASHIITVSDHARHEIIDAFGLPAHKVTRIYEAADPIFDEMPTNTDAVFKKYDVPSPYFFYVGGWDERKNLPYLFQAFAQTTGAHLVVAGGNKAEAENVKNIDSRIHTLGWVDDEDLPALYAGARAFVYPSRYEGFGLQLCEAMRMGCPVLAANATSLKEVLGRGGELFSLDSVSSVTALLQRVANDDAYHAELKQKAAERSQSFTWAQTARETYEVYQKLLS